MIIFNYVVVSLANKEYGKFVSYVLIVLVSSLVSSKR